MNRSGIVLLALVLFTLTPEVTSAQAAPAPAPATVPDVALPPVGETLALDLNQRAPWAGMLVRDEDLFALQSSLMTTQFQLENARSMYAEALAGRASLLADATRLCDERVQLHDSLWTDRRDELVRALAASQARQGAQWYEVAGYVAIGLVVGLVVGVPVGLALH